MGSNIKYIYTEWADGREAKKAYDFVIDTVSFIGFMRNRTYEDGSSVMENALLGFAKSWGF